MNKRCRGKTINLVYRIFSWYYFHIYSGGPRRLIFFIYSMVLLRICSFLRLTKIVILSRCVVLSIGNIAYKYKPMQINFNGNLSNYYNTVWILSNYTCSTYKILAFFLFIFHSFFVVFICNVSYYTYYCYPFCYDIEKIFIPIKWESLRSRNY